jgi:predicted acetyltransferase
MNPRLIEPSIVCKESYLAALKEYHTEGRFIEDTDEAVAADFELYVEKEKAKARGENLKPGYVPETRLWLVDGDEYIGEVGIRHSLTPHLKEIGGHIGYVIRPSKRRMGYGKKILVLSLPKAKELGIERALLTCDVTNTASDKIIESAGGILENDVPNPGGPDKHRYWIELV